MAEVILKNISKTFGTQLVVDAVNLEIKDGEFISLLGPSGCGKTTALRMIAGLEDIDSGELYVDNKLFNNIPAKDRGVAMVFQSYALFPHMTVQENIAFGLKVRKIKRAEALKKVSWAMDIMSLEGLETRYPRELSGGQRQRVALGRALVLEPKVMLLDEPLSNLDPALRDRMTAELKRLHRQIGKTIIYVTHNQIEAMTLSDRIAVMQDGKIVQCDSPTQMYNFPSCEFVAHFIGTPSMNFFEAVVSRSAEGVELVVEGSQKLRLDQKSEENLKNMEGCTVLAGIRPHHIYCQPSKYGRRHSDTVIPVEIDIVEALGEQNLVMAKFGNLPLVFLADPEIPMKTEARMQVVIDGRKLHFFNCETKARLFI